MQKKILVIDDSALMRRKLTSIIESIEDFEIRTARDGQDGLEQAKAWRPDLVTLDINMPVMDGITCLSLLMNYAPCPVIMVSSLTETGALATFEALELGAIDYVAKPGGTVSVNIDDVAEELTAKIKAALNSNALTKRASRLARSPSKQKTVKAKFSSKTSSSNIVVVGVSTGGPSTLETLLTALPSNFNAPVLVAQHMPARFTQVFSERLNKICDLEITHVDRPQALNPGNVLIARGNADLIVAKRGGKIMAVSVPENEDLWHPSVERLVASSLEHFPADNIIGVMLTGMGYDGAETMAKVKMDGGRTIAESEETAVVYGMPRELVNRDGATKVLPCDEIAQQLVDWVGVSE
ncbi:MAG: chemotaxis-specific protein-glutamate methyltransferase CheB [Pseudomonadota bacterium]